MSSDIASNLTTEVDEFVLNNNIGNHDLNKVLYSIVQAIRKLESSIGN